MHPTSEDLFGAFRIPTSDSMNGVRREVQTERRSRRTLYGHGTSQKRDTLETRSICRGLPDEDD
jgi:hypothetical protein